MLMTHDSLNNGNTVKLLSYIQFFTFIINIVLNILILFRGYFQRVNVK